jgi:hypothetical protein
MKPLCDLCCTRHESWQAHQFAINKPAINKPATNTERLTDATNGSPGEAVRETGRATATLGVGADTGDVGRGEVVRREPSGMAREDQAGRADDRTPNRRSRESYNAYQREYMRKRRAVRG